MKRFTPASSASERRAAALVGFRASVVTNASGPRVVVAGEIDMDTAPTLRQAVSEALAGTNSLEVDVTAVTFIDSCGLAILAKAADDTAAAGGSVRLVGASAMTRRLLEICGLDAVIEVRTG